MRQITFDGATLTTWFATDTQREQWRAATRRLRGLGLDWATTAADLIDDLMANGSLDDTERTVAANTGAVAAYRACTGTPTTR